MLDHDFKPQCLMPDANTVVLRTDIFSCQGYVMLSLPDKFDFGQPAFSFKVTPEFKHEILSVDHLAEISVAKSESIIYVSIKFSIAANAILFKLKYS